VSHSKLDSCGYELRIRGGSMKVLRGDLLSFGILGVMVSIRWLVRWSPCLLSYQLALLLGVL
jgi:hypothetical protein